MLNRTPLALAVLTAFAAPLAAAPAFAQTSATAAVTASGTRATPAAAVSGTAGTGASATTAPAANTATQGALPTVSVTGQADPDQAFNPGVSSVGGSTSKAVRDIAQGVVVVDQALLQSQGLTSFSDALRNVPGVTIGAAEGGSIGNNVNLRGFTARTDIYLDGFRDRGQYYRDTFDLESIDVLYGPSSMLFGRGSTGGVINQVSKKPNLGNASSVSTTIGTDSHYRASFDVDHAISDTAAVRINGFGQDLGSSRDIMKNKDYGFAPSVRFGIGTPTEVTISALIQHNYDQPDYGVPSVNGRPANVGFDKFYGLTNEATLQNTQIFTATVVHHFNDNLELRNQTQYAHYAVNADETGPNAPLLLGPVAGSPTAVGNLSNLPLSQLWVQLGSHDRVINDHSIYNTTDLISKFTTGPFKHELTTGIEVGRDTYTNQSITLGNLPILNLANPVYESQPGNVTTTPGNTARASANSFAVYANDTIDLTKQLKFVGGLRWDRYAAEFSNSISVPGFAAQTNDFTSVRAGLIYQPTDWSSYYVSYGTSFDPSLEALTLTNGTQGLPPESTKTYEVGSKFDFFNGNLSFNQALFDTDQNNSRTAQADGTYTLDGDVRVRGYQAGISGSPIKHVKLFAGYTYLNSTILQASDGTQGKQLANTPRHTFTLWATWEPKPHWEVGGGPTVMSSVYAANTDLVRVPGYVRWDATAAYIQKKWDFRLNLLNLTNKGYYSGVIASDGGRAVPGIGRELLATVNYRF